MAEANLYIWRMKNTEHSEQTKITWRMKNTEHSEQTKITFEETNADKCLSGFGF